MLRKLGAVSNGDAWFTLEDAKASFNLFCCVYGIGTLGMPANFARAGPTYAVLALLFMAIANIYASVVVSKVMLVAPSHVKTYGDLGEFAMGRTGRVLVVATQMGCCLLVPCAFLVLGGTLLQVLFPNSFSQTFWIVFMTLAVFPVCLVPTLKEGAGMAFAGCLGTIISDVIGVGVLMHEMQGHPTIPAPHVTFHQVLTTFGNLSLAYGAAIVIPDLQRQHSQPSRMPRVIFVTLFVISVCFLTLATTGYSAAGCQISGNLLFSIAGAPSTGKSPLGFVAHRGAVVMAFLFMQLHITIAFAVILHPAFFIAERLVLGMHTGESSEEYHQMHELKVTPVRKAGAHVTHHLNGTGEADDVEDVDLSDAESGGDSAAYRGRRNVMRYVALRTTMVTLLVMLSVALKDHFLELADFIGASCISMSCLVLPLVFYLKVFWPNLPAYERVVAITIAVLCSVVGLYVVCSLAFDFIHPSTPEHPPVFKFCEPEYQFLPYYERNVTAHT